MIVPPVTPKRWTFNQSQTDDEVRAYYEGLKIVSKPGALYGPPLPPKPTVFDDTRGLLDPRTGLLKRACNACGGWWVQTEPAKKRVGGTCSCQPASSPVSSSSPP